jgi:hypothetical protein
MDMYTQNVVHKEKYKNLTSHSEQNKSYNVQCWEIQTHSTTDTVYTLNNCMIHIHQPLKSKYTHKSSHWLLRKLKRFMAIIFLSMQASKHEQNRKSNKRVWGKIKNINIHMFTKVQLAIYTSYLIVICFLWTENTQMRLWRNSVILSKIFALSTELVSTTWGLSLLHPASPGSDSPSWNRGDCFHRQPLRNLATLLQALSPTLLLGRETDRYGGSVTINKRLTMHPSKTWHKEVSKWVK